MRSLLRYSSTRIVLLCFVVATSSRGQTAGQIEREISRHCANLPFAMPKISVPTFPDFTVSIVDHGAIPDGFTLNTDAFAHAIRACAMAGGGTVLVPPGTWLTGPITLESNINLHLERGALVQFSHRLDDYPLIAGYDGKSKRFIVTPPIHAYRAKNIAITGDGIFDGAGEAWRYVKKSKLTAQEWKDLIASGGVVSPDGTEWWPSRESLEGAAYLKELEQSGRKPAMEDYARVREFIRPDLAPLVQCDGILLDGVTFQNSPRFHVRPAQSQNVIIRNITIRCPWYAQNGDGLDPSSCRNVIIYNTTVDVGDDGLCLKPGSIAGSQTPGPACENIVIADCVVYRAHGGFVIGSESYGGVNNVAVRNCVFVGTDIGLRFKSYRGNGGVVRNVFIDGIQMRNIANDAILFDMYYAGNSPDVETQKDIAVRKAEPVTDRTPRFQDFTIKNVVCNGASRALLINALPEMPIKNITFTNVSISAKEGVVLADAEGITFNQCRVVPHAGPVMRVIQSRNITINGGTYAPETTFFRVDGESSSNILLRGVRIGESKKLIEVGGGAQSGAVLYEPDGK